VLKSEEEKQQAKKPLEMWVSQERKEEKTDEENELADREVAFGDGGGSGPDAGGAGDSPKACPKAGADNGARVTARRLLSKISSGSSSFGSDRSSPAPPRPPSEAK
jgi:hypothetical protein